MQAVDQELIGVPLRTNAFQRTPPGLPAPTITSFPFSRENTPYWGSSFDSFPMTPENTPLDRFQCRPSGQEDVYSSSTQDVIAKLLAGGASSNLSQVAADSGSPSHMSLHDDLHAIPAPQDSPSEQHDQPVDQDWMFESFDSLPNSIGDPFHQFASTSTPYLAPRIDSPTPPHRQPCGPDRQGVPRRQYDSCRQARMLYGVRMQHLLQESRMQPQQLLQQQRPYMQHQPDVQNDFSLQDDISTFSPARISLDSPTAPKCISIPSTHLGFRHTADSPRLASRPECTIQPPPHDFYPLPHVEDLSVEVGQISGGMLDDPSSCLPSLGSFGHPHSCRAPCKYAPRGRGCKDGVKCTRCHLCIWKKNRTKH